MRSIDTGLTLILLRDEPLSEKTVSFIKVIIAMFCLMFFKC